MCTLQFGANLTENLEKMGVSNNWICIQNFMTLGVLKESVT